MDMFKVVAQYYSQEGALTSKQESFYFGSADAAEEMYNKLNLDHWINEDGKPGFKKYKMSLYVQSYKKIEDVESFFDQFK